MARGIEGSTSPINDAERGVRMDGFGMREFLYLPFSYGYVSTECNVGPIINIILLELLVLMATYKSLNTTGPPLVMIIGTVSSRA